MRRLVSIYRIGDGHKELRIFKSPKKMRGEVRCFTTNEPLMSADFFDKEASEYRVKEYFGFGNGYKVPFKHQHGKVILYPIDKWQRIIWTNDDYDEWKKAMIEEGEKEDALSYERYGEDCDIYLGDERTNLDVDVDGWIVAFADLGLWMGRRIGSKVIGNNVADILSSDCEYVTWFCDPYNVRCRATHHDGTNYILYRVAESKEKAEEIARKISYRKMSEEQFRRATKSLRPYVANVYGW